MERNRLRSATIGSDHEFRKWLGAKRVRLDGKSRVRLDGKSRVRLDGKS